VPALSRKRRTLHWPITISVSLMTLNVALMVGWILLAASIREWNALTIGTVAFALVLVGLTFYMVLTIKEFRVSQQQSNFVDSVTHELKTPIASLRLYLETLQIRNLTDEQRQEFYSVMDVELRRLDDLINHLLEVGRLDALGRTQEPEDVPIDELLRGCARKACAHHKLDEDGTVTYQVEPVLIRGRRLVLEMIFSNLLDNALKYAGSPPQIVVEAKSAAGGRLLVRISDNGRGVPPALRKKIFRIFFRVGNELERTRQGTGLGLYIVRTLVRIMKGSVCVRDRAGGGSTFEVELPGRVAQ
jgi:signal transduction histidine kinase